MEETTLQYKKITILAIILACLLCISAVSATENITDNIVSADETSDDVISVNNTEDIVSTKETDGSLSIEDNYHSIPSF